MNIKQITLAGEYEIDIIRTDQGATVQRDGAPLLRIGRFETREQRIEKASRIAECIFGTDPKRGGPRCTNSEIHDVLRGRSRPARMGRGGRDDHLPEMPDELQDLPAHPPAPRAAS